MNYIHRELEVSIKQSLQRGKSVLLLGARQTGKSTLIQHQLQPDLSLSLADLNIQLAFEKQPERLMQEVGALNITAPHRLPLVIIDEIQKNPRLMDGVQYLIDNQKAQFVITGSSARKLKRHSNINLLPGRVVRLQLDPLCLEEISRTTHVLEKLLLYGTLPGILLQANDQNRQQDLTSYVISYLQEEIRAEALVRQLGSFTKFLEYAALSAGQPLNLSKLSQDIGITRVTLHEYFQILEDCLIATRIEPLTKTNTRRRLTKAPKYLFFDTGIRRECVHLGTRLSEKQYGELFEEFIGNEILRWLRLHYASGRLFYWRDHAGPEIDYIIEAEQGYLPIEVKWTDSPQQNDCKHLEKFLEEYPCLPYAYLVCRVPRKLLLKPRILALPWHELPEQLSLLIKNN